MASHQAHNISKGCSKIRLQANKGVTMSEPIFNGARIIISMCTGKKAVSIRMISMEPALCVGLYRSNNPDITSVVPAKIFNRAGTGSQCGMI